MILHINREELKEVVRRPDGKWRWCFTCRKQRRFEYVVQVPVDPMSWYGQSPKIECATCHTIDGDMFPGTYREWSDE